jgi:hypothetical protein
MNQYIVNVQAILGSAYNNGNISFRWSTPQEAKQYIALIRQMQKEIKLVKHDVTQAKKQIHAQYAAKKTQIGKGLGAGIETFMFGAKNVGKVNALARQNVRNQELKALEPYVQAERFISDVLTKLDGFKLQMDAWIAQHKP